MGIFSKLTGMLKKVDTAVISETNVDVRTKMLETASLYYEFPMLSIEYPPCNKFFDNAFVHAFQRSGFRPEQVNRSRRTSDDSSSLQVPFEGLIKGKEFFVSKSNKILLILGVLTLPIFIGLIFLFLYFKKAKQTPMEATLSYWGINQYTVTPISNFMTNVAANQNGETYIANTEGKSVSLELNADSIEKLTHLHPIRTVLNLALGIEVKPGQYENEQAVEQKLRTLVSKIQDEIALQPVAFPNTKQSSEASATPIFRWVAAGGTLNDIQSRFPY